MTGPNNVTSRRGFLLGVSGLLVGAAGGLLAGRHCGRGTPPSTRNMITNAKCAKINDRKLEDALANRPVIADASVPMPDAKAYPMIEPAILFGRCVIDPGKGTQGKTLDMTMNAFLLLDGKPAKASAQDLKIQLGEGITVRDITADPSGVITFKVDITKDANPGMRDIAITYAGKTETQKNAFEVVKPYIRRPIPDMGMTFGIEQ